MKYSREGDTDVYQVRRSHAGVEDAKIEQIEGQLGSQAKGVVEDGKNLHSLGQVECQQREFDMERMRQVTYLSVGGRYCNNWNIPLMRPDYSRILPEC